MASETTPKCAHRRQDGFSRETATVPASATGEVNMPNRVNHVVTIATLATERTNVLWSRCTDCGESLRMLMPPDWDGAVFIKSGPSIVTIYV